MRLTLCALVLELAACSGQQPPSPAGSASQAGAQSAGSGGPLSTRNMEAVKGQQVTCAGSREKTFDLDVIETDGVELGLSTTFAAWTYNGRIPGPTLEVCEGDTVTIHVHNKGTTSHGLDTHAFKIDAQKYGPTAPGTTLTMEKVVDTPGVFLYHCAAGPVTDLHIKSGIHGAMIVYRRDKPLPPAREIVVVEDAVYGSRDADGFIPGTDPARTEKNDPIFAMFNGRLDNDPVKVKAGDHVRIYFVNVGPGAASAHVIGAIFDRVYDGQTEISGVQTYLVPAGGGAILEFTIPEVGLFLFVDHDKLAYLPWGMALAFQAE
jgi:nitrite reductase (NO-forming)